MDWVQWYYAVWLVSGIIVRTLVGFMYPDKSVATFGEIAMSQPIGLLLALPVIGRVFGWW